MDGSATHLPYPLLPWCVPGGSLKALPSTAYLLSQQWFLSLATKSLVRNGKGWMDPEVSGYVFLTMC